MFVSPEIISFCLQTAAQSVLLQSVSVDSVNIELPRVTVISTAVKPVLLFRNGFTRGTNTQETVMSVEVSSETL